MPQVRYHKHPFTRHKTRAAPRRTRLRQHCLVNKNWWFLVGTITTLTLNFIYSFLLFHIPVFQIVSRSKSSNRIKPSLLNQIPVVPIGSSPPKKKGRRLYIRAPSKVRYRQAPVYKTQSKSRAQTDASPSALSCKQKLVVFSWDNNYVNAEFYL